ncbi:MAG: glycosyltransferase family 9 protein [Chlamydiae bacterium]|nr:glycosyltransferase family 9 protein [Chlamydiota bacterium]
MVLDRVAVIPSIGIGDGLIMMVVSHRLYCQDYKVTTFSKPLLELKTYFRGHDFQLRPSQELIEDTFSSYDLIILQNDNSSFAKGLIALHQEGKLKALSVFYPSYEEGKHAPLTPLDRVFHENHCMVDNTARAISSLLGLNHFSKNNGLFIGENFQHRRFKNRVLLHPTSLDEKRNWPLHKYLHVATLLEQRGFHPVFIVAPHERDSLAPLVQERFEMPLFPTLDTLAAYAFESGYLIGNDSGIGHLCSNLQIPTLILSNRKKYMKLWRPGWYRGDIVTPAAWIPNFKGSRWRERKWKQWISTRKVLQKFHKLLDKEIFL